MNYKHIYHAGNFCDVFKHVLLISLIEFLKMKETPFCYLETHAGSGQYALDSALALKTQEYKNGIAKLFANNQALKENPKLIQTYLDIVNEQGFPSYYPGSPLIAHAILRTIDRMVLCELSASEAKALKSLFYGKSQVAVHQQDGYQGLKAFLPPKERRSLILIDPPFEEADEWIKLVNGVKMAYQRFPTGIFAIWYPLKDRVAVEDFKQGVRSINSENTLFAELSIYPDDIKAGLIGCGMAIINPPWQWQESFAKVLPWLWKVLSVKQQGSYTLHN